MELDPNIATVAIVTMAVGYLMALAGIHKSALEWRRRQRICPSCGRPIVARACKCVSGS
jgi:NADH pyrophosphatase NudC (nudix superfamily)